ncbi:uncharacterized protein N7525_001676 [Penicillium rubens]|uniref:uncharacterized protein n=1 Tax=Penicillium rubens TaxID=1108849 RepID=UPI002A5A28F9|nr:uncharacterized protein N7525_001676 [Penicillium rubens]KAJ5843935.1 hypothetical protein N7525_001676 [Penicillium rubens]
MTNSRQRLTTAHKKASSDTTTQSQELNMARAQTSLSLSVVNTSFGSTYGDSGQSPASRLLGESFMVREGREIERLANIQHNSGEEKEEQ